MNTYVYRIEKASLIFKLGKCQYLFLGCNSYGTELIRTRQPLNVGSLVNHTCYHFEDKSGEFCGIEVAKNIGNYIVKKCRLGNILGDFNGSKVTDLIHVYDPDSSIAGIVEIVLSFDLKDRELVNELSRTQERYDEDLLTDTELEEREEVYEKYKQSDSVSYWKEKIKDFDKLFKPVDAF